MVALPWSRSKRDFGPTRAMGTFRVMNRRVVVALIGVFVVGALIGVLVALAANSSSDAESDPPSADDCADAVSVVDAAGERFADVASTPAEQDATLLAALLTEQAIIAYAMEAEPGCFSLEERATAAGLLDALEALIAVSEINTELTPPAPVDAPPAPVDSPPTTDPGE